jgi:hypothetical protein
MTYVESLLHLFRSWRMSLRAARLVTEELGKCAGVEIDLSGTPLAGIEK